VENVDLIAISDIYGDISIVKEFLSRLNESKKHNRIIVVAGDLGIKTRSQNYFENVNKILDLLSKKCKYLFYVPGDSDVEDLAVSYQNIINIDKNNFIIEMDDVRVGLLGFGGAPAHSVREKKFFSYLWDESIPIVRENLMMNLRINLEKVMTYRPDYIVLVTHAPPFGIADYSRPITLSEEVLLGELLEELEVETEKDETKKLARNPRHLGSRTLREFVRYYKPDVHIFAHVHKQGGKVLTKNGTMFCNVSHLSSLPYRLTGRKFLFLRLTKEEVTFFFDSVVIKNLSFQDFLEAYL